MYKRIFIYTIGQQTQKDVSARRIQQSNGVLIRAVYAISLQQETRERLIDN